MRARIAGPIRHSGWEFSASERRVAIGDQRGGALRGFIERHLLQQSGAKIDDENILPIQFRAEPQEFVVAEVVRHQIAFVAGAHRAAGVASGHVADHVAPVQKISVGPAGKTYDWDVHAAEQFDDAGLQAVSPGNQRALGANLAPAWPFHETAENARIHGADSFVLYDTTDFRSRSGQPDSEAGEKNEADEQRKAESHFFNKARRSSSSACWQVTCLNVSRSKRLVGFKTKVCFALASAMKTVPTGFSGVPPPGPAMPVMAMAKSASNNFARALGHFAGGWFAHRPVLRQRFGANADQFLFRFIAIRDQPAQKDFDAPGTSVIRFAT